MKCAGTGPPGSTTACTHAMGAAAFTRERPVEPSPGCARARDTVRWTKAVAMTVKHVGSRNVWTLG